MGDVIIAVAPAPGHEHLIAYGKHHPWCDSERPMERLRSIVAPLSTLLLLDADGNEVSP